MSRLLLLSLLAACVTRSALGQASTDSTVKDTTRLPDAVVRAAREPIAARYRATVFDILTPAERDERQLDRLADALRYLVGGGIVVSGANGGTTSLFFRGVTSSQTLLLIDGIRINDANASPGATLAALRLSSDDIVEIARGPQSTSFGGAAMGGVAAIGSARVKSGLRFESTARGGTYSTYEGRVNASYGTPSVDVAGSVGAIKTNNERRYNGDDARNANLRTEYRFARDWRLNASVRHLGQRYSSPGDIRSTNDTPYGITEFNQLLVSGIVSGTILPRWGTQLTAGGQNYDLLGRSYYFGLEFLSQLNVDRRVIDWQHRIDVGKRIVAVAGGNAEWTKAETNGGARDDALRAGYGEIIARPLANLVMSGGARYDDYRSFGGKTTGRMGASYLVSPIKTKIRATYGTGFLPPSLSARYGGPFQHPNPEIRPEQSTGWDAGLDWFISEEGSVVSATWFNNRITDLIVYQGAPYPELGQEVNVGRARTRGAELNGTIVTSKVELRGGYRYLEAVDLTVDDPDSARLIRRPKHSISADALWRWRAGTVGIGAFGSLDRLDTDFSDFPFQRVDPGDFIDARLLARWDIKPTFRLDARLDNLFGKRYEEVYGYPALGRRITVGLTFITP